jgi:hypothetical protein
MREAAKEPAPVMPNKYVQAVASSNITPMWAQALSAGTSASPNVVWQGTSSGATYCSASSVLKP